MKIQYGILSIIIIYIFSILLFTNCGKSISCCIIEMPPVSFTPERTSLENQILGTYQEIREDVWLVSSSQTVEGLSITSTTNTNLKQDFDVDYKVIIGENNKGMISYRENDFMEKDPMEKQKLYEIMDEINNARQVLMLEVINKNENLTLDDLDKVKKTFANMYRKEAKKGEWVQDDEGDWSKKK